MKIQLKKLLIFILIGISTSLWGMEKEDDFNLLPPNIQAFINLKNFSTSDETKIIKQFNAGKLLNPIDTIKIEPVDIGNKTIDAVTVTLRSLFYIASYKQKNFDNKNLPESDVLISAYPDPLKIQYYIDTINNKEASKIYLTFKDSSQKNHVAALHTTKLPLDTYKKFNYWLTYKTEFNNFESVEYNIHKNEFTFKNLQKEAFIPEPSQQLISDFFSLIKTIINILNIEFNKKTLLSYVNFAAERNINLVIQEPHIYSQTPSIYPKIEKPAGKKEQNLTGSTPFETPVGSGLSSLQDSSVLEEKKEDDAIDIAAAANQAAIERTLEEALKDLAPLTKSGPNITEQVAENVVENPTGTPDQPQSIPETPIINQQVPQGTSSKIEEKANAEEEFFKQPTKVPVTVILPQQEATDPKPNQQPTSATTIKSTPPKPQSWGAWFSNSKFALGAFAVFAAVAGIYLYFSGERTAASIR